MRFLGAPLLCVAAVLVAARFLSSPGGSVVVYVRAPEDLTTTSDSWLLLSSLVPRDVVEQDDLREVLASREQASFNSTARSLAAGAAAFVALGDLDDSRRQALGAAITALREEHFGFRPNDGAAGSTVSGTYYALEGLRMLGRLDDFIRTPGAVEAVGAFITSMASEAGGFHDRRGSTAQIDTTWRAVHVLRALGVECQNVTEVAAFLLECQLDDGSFQNTRVKTWHKFLTGAGTATATAQALHLLHMLKSEGVASREEYDAQSFLASTISSTGVSANAAAAAPDASSSLAVALLTRDAPHALPALPRWTQVTCFWAGLAAAIAGVYLIAAPNLAPDVRATLWHFVLPAAFFLSLVLVASAVHALAGLGSALLFAGYLEFVRRRLSALEPVAIQTAESAAAVGAIIDVTAVALLHLRRSAVEGFDVVYWGLVLCPLASVLAAAVVTFTAAAPPRPASLVWAAVAIWLCHSVAVAAPYFGFGLGMLAHLASIGGHTVALLAVAPWTVLCAAMLATALATPPLTRRAWRTPAT